jgi:hypothetical protein
MILSLFQVESADPFSLEHQIFSTATEEQRQAADEQLKRLDRLAKLTCSLCGKTFVKKTNLKHHLMLHRGEKPWKCHVCEWRFVQKCNLKKHLESHVTGAFLCPSCDTREAILVHNSRSFFIHKKFRVADPDPH